MASWGCVLIILVKGVRSSGKASYFLALFPYVGMGILLVRACTLEGAVNGILYFIKPQFGRLLDPTVSNFVQNCTFNLRHELELVFTGVVCSRNAMFLFAICMFR